MGKQMFTHLHYIENLTISYVFAGFCILHVKIDYIVIKSDNTKHENKN